MMQSYTAEDLNVSYFEASPPGRAASMTLRRGLQPRDANGHPVNWRLAMDTWTAAKVAWTAAKAEHDAATSWSRPCGCAYDGDRRRFAGCETRQRMVRRVVDLEMRRHRGPEMYDAGLALRRHDGSME